MEDVLDHGRGWSEMSFKVPETTHILLKYTMSCQVSKKYIQPDSSRRNPFQEPFEGPQRLQPHVQQTCTGIPVDLFRSSREGDAQARTQCRRTISLSVGGTGRGGGERDWKERQQQLPTRVMRREQKCEEHQNNLILDPTTQDNGEK